MLKTQKEIKLKNGATLPKGLPVTFIKESPSRCLVQSPDRAEPYRVRVTSAFRVPGMQALNDMSMDSVCESIAGYNVEPDGWDEEGTPSWLLALGLI